MFHPNGKWVYCVNELKSTVNLLSWDAKQGALETCRRSPAAGGHQGPSAPSDIVMDRQGRFAYVANRLDDFMASFTISPADGKLALIERTPAAARCRATSPLIPAKAGYWWPISRRTTSQSFARDKKSGHLANTGKSFPLSRPQCLVFA